MKYCNKNVYICDRWEFYLYYSICTHFYSLLHGIKYVTLHTIKKGSFLSKQNVFFFFSFTAMFQRRTYKKCNCVTHHQAKRE